MIDLKNEMSPEQRIKNAADTAVQEATVKVQHEVAEAVNAARVAASALAEMPKAASDLVAAAAVAVVTEFSTTNLSGNPCADDFMIYHDNQQIASARNYRDRGFNDNKRVLKPGRYRVLLFVVPIEKFEQEKR